MMSTQNQVDQHGVIQSSIALLQERFKQLQRVKEMREKKELLRLFSDYKTFTPPPENNNKNNNSFNYEPTSSHNSTIINDNDKDDDELQIFLPPNYYYSRSKPSSFSSSSILSHNNHNNYHNNNNNNHNDISLSLWPPTMSSYNNVTAFEAPRSKMSRPPSSCVSSASKYEDSQHVSEVDTTLHL